MRINLFFAFSISTFLCIIISNTISFFTPQNAYWIYIIPAIFLLLTIFYEKIKFLKKKTAKIFLAISVSIPYLVFVFYIFICMLNYPQENSFEAKLKPELVTEQEIDAGNQLDKKFYEFEKKLDTIDEELINKLDIIDSDKSKIIELLNKTNADRKEIIEYINKNSIAVPYVFDTTRKYYILSDNLSDTSDNSKINLSTLVVIFKLELFEVEILKMDQKHDEAVNKYILAWHNLANACKIKNTNITGFLCLTAISQSLGKYYYNNQNTFLSYDLTEVANLKKDIMDNLDRTYKVGFINEYTAFKTMLEDSKNIWPLMDRNKQLRKLDGVYYSIVEFEKNPLNTVPFEEPVDFSSQRNYIFLKDFIGEFVYSAKARMFSGLSTNIVKGKNELSVYFYAMDKNNYQNVPKDYFTGEKFKTSEFPDRIEIDAYTKGNLGSLQKYVIIK